MNPIVLPDRPPPRAAPDLDGARPLVPSQADAVAALKGRGPAAPISSVVCRRCGAVMGGACAPASTKGTEWTAGPVVWGKTASGTPWAALLHARGLPRSLVFWCHKDGTHDVATTQVEAKASQAATLRV